MDSVELSSDENDASFADSSFASPTPPCPPPRSTPAPNHAANSRQKLTPQSRGSVYVNVASTGLRRVQGRPSADPSSGGRGYSSVSPCSEAAVPSPVPSPTLPNRLDFSAGDGGQPAAAVRTKTVSTMEIFIVLAGALAAICMTAFVDSGMGIQLYSAPASPQVDSIPNTVRSLSPEILGCGFPLMN